MVFDRDRDPSDELEDYGDELTSDYREEGEEEPSEGAEDLEDEVSYEVEETSSFCRRGGRGSEAGVGRAPTTGQASAQGEGR